MPLIDAAWKRIELVPMDPHCGDISLALYRRDDPGGPVACVHTYSAKPEAAARVNAVTRAVGALGGLDRVERENTYLAYRCGTWHQAASKRLFLEACKLDSDTEPEARPLEILDPKSGQQIQVERRGSGRYRVVATQAADGDASRAPAIAAGLAKLAELTIAEDDQAVLAFPCGHDHDALVGLLLRRALNVRAVLREEEAVASKGVLAAPSAQER